MDQHCTVQIIHRPIQFIIRNFAKNDKKKRKKKEWNFTHQKAHWKLKWTYIIKWKLMETANTYLWVNCFVLFFVFCFLFCFFVFFFLFSLFFLTQKYKNKQSLYTKCYILLTKYLSNQKVSHLFHLISEHAYN